MVAVVTIVVLVLLVGGTMLLRPGAPRHVVLATGGATSTFFRFGQAYQKILREQGVDLEVRAQDSGPAENVRRLESPGSDVQVAIVHGGTMEIEMEDPSDLSDLQKHHPDLVTLGTLFSEPVWIFHRLPGEPDRLSALTGKRVAIGSKGSVSNTLARLLLKTAGVDVSTVTLVEGKGIEAAAAISKGEIDATIFSAPLDARAVQDLWKVPGVTLMSLSQAEAFTRRLPWMTQAVLPAGALDIARSVPARDVKLLASGGSFVAHRDLHPGIVYLLLAAAAQVHGGANAFQHYGEFPSLSNVDLPVHESARRYFKEGPSLLYRYLPFWLASILDRVGVVLPIVALVLSIARYAPPLYDWFVQNRITRCYGELRYLEDEVDRASGGGDRDSFLTRFREIEARAANLSAPLRYAPQLYTLRSHILFVRDKLNERSVAEAARPDPAVRSG